jgi:heme-degrading monooxygenase HmoA
MIVRVWRGEAMAEKADAYHQHVTRNVFPLLTKIAGHRGAYVLRRESGDRVEFLVATLWESMDSIREFAGDRPEAAVVEPEARAVLANYDDFVRHYDLVHVQEADGRSG